MDLKFLRRTVRDPERMLWCALPEGTTLLAILNAVDETLEKFWSDGPVARGELFHRLKDVGFVGCTGPTFSIMHDATERLPYHNEISLRRHHRILQEIADAGLVPIPNLYTTGRRSTQQIASWLNEHPQIELVSRDLTMTRFARPFATEYQGLCDLLSQVHRPRHVLLPGVSMKRAELVIRGLARLGHSVSLVTGDPILKAIRGRRLYMNADGSMTQIRGTASRTELINGNIEAALKFVDELRQSLPLALTPAFGAIREKQLQWQGFLRRSGVLVAPQELASVVAGTAAFLEPVIEAARRGSALRATWLAGGPWSRADAGGEPLP
ncbi:MAG: hypothetical protein ACYC7F_01025 [Gemmatimonadaceae bacterium]